MKMKASLNEEKTVKNEKLVKHMDLIAVMCMYVYRVPTTAQLIIFNKPARTKTLLKMCTVSIVSCIATAHNILFHVQQVQPNKTSFNDRH